MPVSALPPHLQANQTAEGDGTDWDNPIQRKWNRGWFAFSHRSEQGVDWLYIPIPYTRIGIPFFPILRQWRKFPVVLLAYNAPRWMGEADTSVAFVGRFVNKLIGFWTDKSQVPITEMNENHQRFNLGDVVDLRGNYGVSPIQNLCYGVSFQVTWPLHVAASYRSQTRYFGFRVGARWDSLDMYFGCPDFAGPQIN